MTISELERRVKKQEKRFYKVILAIVLVGILQVAVSGWGLYILLTTTVYEETIIIEVDSRDGGDAFFSGFQGGNITKEVHNGKNSSD